MANLFALVFLISLVALPVGLMKPTLFQGLIKKLLGKDANRKNLAGSFSALALVSFMGIGLTAPTPVKNVEDESEPVEVSEEAQPVETTELTLEKTAEENVKVEMEPATTTSEEGVEESVTVAEPQSVSSASSDESTPKSETTQEYTAPVYEEPALTPTSWYSCSSNIYNCTDFSTHAEAQSVYQGCLAQVGYDVHELDGNDNDGLACESLP